MVQPPAGCAGHPTTARTQHELGSRACALRVLRMINTLGHLRDLRRPLWSAMCEKTKSYRYLKHARSCAAAWCKGGASTRRAAAQYIAHGSQSTQRDAHTHHPVATNPNDYPLLHYRLGFWQLHSMHLVACTRIARYVASSPLSSRQPASISPTVARPLPPRRRTVFMSSSRYRTNPPNGPSDSDATSTPVI